MAVTVLTVEDYRALQKPVSNDVTIAIVDEGSNIENLSDDEFAALEANNVVSIDAENNILILGNEAAIAIAESNISFGDDDVVTVYTDKYGLGYSSEEITRLSNKGVDVISWTLNMVARELNVDQAKALVESNITLHKSQTEQTVSIVVDENDFHRLTRDDLAELIEMGVNSIHARNSQITLNLDQYIALDSVYLSPDATIAMEVSLQEATRLSREQITGFTAKGIDILSLKASSQVLSSVSAQDLASFSDKGIAVLDASDNVLALSLSQYKALGSIGLVASDIVTLSDAGANLAALTAAQISALATADIDGIDASDNRLALSLDQYNALGATKLASSDTVTLFEGGATLAALSAAQITALATAGIDGLDATDNRLALSLEQFTALGSTKLSASDSVTLSDAGAKLTALGTAQISALANAGVDTLDASNNGYAFSSAQYKALGAIRLSDNDVVTIAADTDIALTNGGNHLTLTGSAVRGTGNSLANTVTGTAKNNILSGLEGNDFLHGALGNDQLNGGMGMDVFVFDTRLNKRSNVDKITDFRYQDDSIWLENKIFTKLGSGTATKPKKFTSDMFTTGTKAQDAEDRIVYDKKTGSLYYDQDGTGSKAQVKIATLTNKAVLKHSDFFVV